MQSECGVHHCPEGSVPEQSFDDFASVLAKHRVRDRATS